MERYETAKLDFVALGEDVVTASRTVTECVPQYNPSVDGVWFWEIIYDNGDVEDNRFPGSSPSDWPSKPDICP